MQKPVAKLADFVKEGNRLVGAVRANAASLPHLQVPVETLEALLSSLDELVIQQGTLQANKQEVSGQIRATLDDGLRHLTFVRKGVRAQFGPRSERLVEFGLQPFRGRSRRTETVKPPVPVVEDSNPA
ncbi:MAG TPA: hypothetical protein VHU81_12430 [Thermoanaerobaculia bacterium]|jgi:hypothetical protein|nr:hypothetical protein [Thermoanaerobaculia bacterium]